MNAESPEANMVRDELRTASRAMAEAAGMAQQALEHAMAFLRQTGPRTGAVKLQTPADGINPYTAGVPVTKPGVVLREDGPKQP